MSKLVHNAGIEFQKNKLQNMEASSALNKLPTHLLTYGTYNFLQYYHFGFCLN